MHPQGFIAKGGDDIVIADHQLQFAGALAGPLFKQRPLPVHMRMEQIPQETDSFRCERFAQAIQPLEVAMQGPSGHRRPVFSEMGDFPQVQVADEQQSFPLPVQGSPGVQLQGLTAEFNRMGHVFKGKDSRVPQKPDLIYRLF